MNGGPERWTSGHASWTAVTVEGAHGGRKSQYAGHYTAGHVDNLKPSITLSKPRIASSNRWRITKTRISCRNPFIFYFFRICFVRLFVSRENIYFIHLENEILRTYCRSFDLRKPNLVKRIGCTQYIRECCQSIAQHIHAANYIILRGKILNLILII